MATSILVVDDDPAICSVFSGYLSASGFTTKTVASLSEARKSLSEERFEAVLLDLKLPDGNGLDFIPELRELRPEIPLVVVTGSGDIPLAVEAMRRGADHFLTKPVKMAELDVFLRKSLELGSLRRKQVAHRRLAKVNEPFIGETTTMQQIASMMKLASENDSTVLLYGETGTGKGVFARWIHHKSARASMPFVELNCSSLRGELLSSELFGHVKGAFTSAVENRQGYIDLADGGTLFLDEIGDMDIGIQSQFLKVLEEKRYRRLGEVQERKSDFRLICATNRNLLDEAKQDRFRKDLYFRINVMPIEVIPLRTRIDDLPDLVRYLVAGLGCSGVEITPQTMLLLKMYSWPGNIRELRNVLERALLLTRRRGPLRPEHFPGLDAQVLLKSSEDEPLDERDLERIRDTLKLFRGDKNKTAEALGISRATLYRRLKKEF